MAKAKPAQETESKPNLSVVEGKGKPKNKPKKIVDGEKLMAAFEKAVKEEDEIKSKLEAAAKKKSDAVEAIHDALVEAGHDGKKFRDPNTKEVLTIMRKEWKKSGTVRWMFRGKSKDENIPEL